MPNDFITLKTLASELDSVLKSGRINKVSSPLSGEFALAVRAGGKNRTLLVSASAVPRVYITEKSFGASSDAPSAFCMLLRKRLGGGVINGVSLINNDRIISINVTTRNELHDEENLTLVAELFLNGANLILCDSDGKIIDASKRVFGDGERCILTGYTYRTPSSNKTSVAEESEIIRFNDVKKDELMKTLSEQITGFSKETLKEAVFLAENDSVSDVFKKLLNPAENGLYMPCILSDDSGVYKGYYLYPYSTSPYKASAVYFDTVYEAAAEYYSVAYSSEKKSKETAVATKLLKRLLSKTEKRIKDCEEKIAESADAEKYLATGEILKCNLGKIKRGAVSVICYDFYNNKDTEIKLDSALSPQKNAEKYFKRYNKMKGAERYARAEAAAQREQLDYLNSIAAALQNCDAPSEYNEIQSELDALCGNRGKVVNTKKKKEKPSSPLRTEIDGFTVYIGKNNRQNEEVTFKIATGGDLWLHTKTYHGAHGIIIRNGKDVPADTVAKAAAIVAYYSNARSLPKAEVDFTLRKNVKKLGKPGLVNYTDYKTVTVEPKKESN